MRKIILSIIFLLTSSGSLGVSTKEALLREELKSSWIRLMKFHADYAVFPKDLAKAGCQLTPELASEYTLTREGGNDWNFGLLFLRAKSGAVPAAISIDENGSFVGVSDLISDNEVVELVRQDLKGLHSAQASYFADFNKFNLKLDQLAFVPSAKLKGKATLTVEVGRVSFLGTYHVTVAGVPMIFRIDQSGVITENSR